MHLMTALFVYKTIDASTCITQWLGAFIDISDNFSFVSKITFDTLGPISGTADICRIADRI